MPEALPPLPRKSAGQAIRDALEHCPGFDGLTARQITRTLEFVQSAGVLELIQARLDDLEAPEALIQTVWTTLTEAQRRQVSDFARGKPNSDANRPLIARLVLKAKGTDDMVEQVILGLSATAIMIDSAIPA